jgi:hypothetical protein
MSPCPARSLDSRSQRPLVAWAIWCDLGADIRRLLERIGSGSPDGINRIVADLNRPRTELRPGTLLTREWEGNLQQVMVLADGFSWNGKTYFPVLTNSDIGRFLHNARDGVPASKTLFKPNTPPPSRSSASATRPACPRFPTSPPSSASSAGRRLKAGGPRAGHKEASLKRRWPGPGPAIASSLAVSACARHACWIADTSQWPPRTRMKVHTSVASSGPPSITLPLARSIVWSLSAKRIATVA